MYYDYLTVMINKMKSTCFCVYCELYQVAYNRQKKGYSQEFNMPSNCNKFLWFIVSLLANEENVASFVFAHICVRIQRCSGSADSIRNRTLAVCAEVLGLARWRN